MSISRLLVVMLALGCGSSPRPSTTPRVEDPTPPSVEAAPAEVAAPAESTPPDDAQLGHGSGPGTGQGIASQPANVSGRLPPEVIQRVVRQNFGRIRVCYDTALRGNPTLQGRIAVRFVIGRNGVVGTASDGGSDMPDSGVVSCVVRSFRGLSFPRPEGGTVTVVYPVVLTPG
jgi:hypothetical protein